MNHYPPPIFSHPLSNPPPPPLQGMGMSPEMMQMMSQMDFSQEKVQAQFSELGLKPEDVIQKVLATPDLAAGFSNPKVQQAIFDISQNPMVSQNTFLRQNAS